ncbi:Dyp-type peroxidase [Corynebacterium ulceribovis]|uniref:Dyp-type peroxidase n=1 Tax=Corynebacterium ulceribovis TaxID=487732 RepID=UPI00037E05D6|nr:Dyp-type peroxidase [Corynebacterium ulceribovis]
MSDKLRRRTFLTAAGAAGISAGAVSLSACSSDDDPQAAADKKQPLVEARVDFDGPHQAGIATPAQARLWLIGLNLKKDVDREGIIRLMRLWTDDARRMTQGGAGLADLEWELLESTASLTTTVGFGRGLLKKAGLEYQAPEWLKPLPEYSRDELDEKWGETDLCLQICCDDSLTLSHAARYLLKGGARYVDIKWVQEGFLNANGSFEKGHTPRNKFGQLDGTINPRSEEELDDIVWINDGPDWLKGGTAMVVRRIEMDLDGWDVLDRASRETVIGRTLDTGAPLTGENEYDKPDMEARDKYGLPVIDRNSHMALSMPADGKPNEKLLRRVYNYDLPPQPGHRFTSNTGLVFICFQQDPLAQFDPIQQRLDKSDRLNQWIFHIGSAVYAIPAGTGPEEYWGQKLLES